MILDVWAKVTGVWTTDKLATLRKLDGFHVWGEEYLGNRLSWRPSQPVTIIELRCSRLAEEVALENRPDIWGCFSFADLPDASRDAVDAAPVLPQEMFWERQKGLRAQLYRSEVQAIFS